MANVLELEVDSDKNANWYFLPIGETIRGRMDYSRETHATSIKEGRELFPKGIPGQRLVLDLDAGQAQIVEPILKDESILKVLKKRGMAPPTEKEPVPVHKDSIPSWLYWIKRGVESGIVKLLRGKLPDKIDGKIQKRFSVPERIDANTQRLDKLTAIIYGMLTPDQKKSADKLLASE
jgi:hypothetical protein